MQRNIRLEREYPHPPEKVWKALTDPQALSQWLMPTDFQPYVGHHFTFKTTSAPGFDGIVQCEVLMVDKPNRLSYSWSGGPMKTSTVVTWHLEPTVNGTRVKLTHTGFEGVPGILVSFILGSGWRDITRNRLSRYLESMSENDEVTEKIQ